MNGTITATGSKIAGDFNVRYVWMISVIAAFGGLLFGYDWVVIGGAKPFYEAYFQLHSQQLVGWANSCALIGCLAGSILSGSMCDKFGRKKLLVLSAFLFALSSILTGWSTTFALFITWRIAGGVAIGIASNVSPTYIAEISPAAWRGRLVTLNQLTIVIGILAAQIVNWLIAEKLTSDVTVEAIRRSWNGQYGWRWMFTAVAVPSVVFFVSAWFVPESPRWLMKKRRPELAQRVLTQIGGVAYASQTLDEIRESIGAESPSALPWRKLLNPRLVRLLGIGIFLAVLQQWSGINIIFNYAEEIYRGAGYGISDMLFNIVITGTINLIFTLIALRFVDTFGRRPLMLFGCAGIGLFHFLIAIAYHAGARGFPVLLLTLCAIACYAMSLAPITWVLISEIFPNQVRGMAVSIAVSSLWIASFILTFTFPIINRAIGSSGTFLGYGFICFIGFWFVLVCVPETKGRTLEQIEQGGGGKAV